MTKQWYPDLTIVVPTLIVGFTLIEKIELLNYGRYAVVTCCCYPQRNQFDIAKQMD
jgi:hypothetical protein